MGERSRSKLAPRVDVQHKYVRRLIAELRRTRIDCGSASVSVSIRARAVKSAADLSLAMVAKGRTAWSRAIILARPGKTSFLKANRSPRQRRILKFRRNFSLYVHTLRRYAAVEAMPWNASSKKPCKRLLRAAASRTRPQSHCEEEQSGCFQLRTLRALVPGSRGLDTPLLLEEAADYITALKMQVDSMQALANHLANPAISVFSCDS